MNSALASSQSLPEPNAAPSEEEDDVDDLDLDLDFEGGDFCNDCSANGGFMMGSSQGGRENKVMRSKPPTPPLRTPASLSTPSKGIGKSGVSGDEHTQFMVINTAANRCGCGLSSLTTTLTTPYFATNAHVALGLAFVWFY